MCCGAALVVGGYVGYMTFFANDRILYVAEAASLCMKHEWETEQIDCWYEVIREEFDDGGTAQALDAFTHVYRTYPAFANSGCHRHAHRVGDMAYYFDYLEHGDLDKVDFPQSANACGYGFYHGFFEHLIQDRPDPHYVTEVCEYFDERLHETAPAIQQTCYHGSGHGFTLAKADTLLDPSEWTIENFTEDANTLCESLPNASDYEISECRQGVYNVIVDWMMDNEYELSYNMDAPFAFCDAVAPDRQADCYYEAAQKLDSVSGFDAKRMGDIVYALPRPDLHGWIMSTGMAGLVQHDPGSDQLDILFGCREVHESLFDACLGGLVGGLSEHGPPQKEYEYAANFCEQDALTDQERTTCYWVLDAQLARFRADDEVVSMCQTGELSQGFCHYRNTGS